MEGSSDLVVGQRISTKTDAAGTGSQLWSDFKNAVGETSNALESVARGINSSAQDILAKKPDLRSRIERLGSSLSGKESPRSVSVEVLPGTGEADIKVSATGLPPNEEIGINVGAMGSASENVARASTDSDGTLSGTARLPAWLPRDKRTVVTIIDEEHNVLARSVSTSLTAHSE